MAVDLQQYAISSATGTVAIPNFQVAFKIVNSNTGATILDKTGANVVKFSDYFATMTTAEKLELRDHIVEFLMRKRIESVTS